MAVLTASPAFAAQTALKNATASAFGASLRLLGTEILAPTPSRSAGPAPGTGSDALLNVPLSTVLSAQAAGAKAVTTLNSDLVANLPPEFLSVISPSGAPKPDRYNARGYARVAGAGLLFTDIPGTLPPAVEPLVPLLPSVLSADAVDSESLISCVDGNPVVVGGSRIVGLKLLGNDLTPLINGTAGQVINVVDTVLGVLGGRATINEVIPAPAGSVGVAVNSVRIELPLLGLDLTLAHSQVNGPAGGTCEPLAPAPAPAPRILARTGGGAASGGLGVATLVGGGMLMLAARRRRKGAPGPNS